MKILIQNILIADPNSPFNELKRDILIENGVVIKIDNNISTENIDTLIDDQNLIIAPGFVDTYCHFNEPGFEYREDLESGSLAALQGGYTDVCIIPNTNPFIDNKSVVSFILNKSLNLKINIHPLGAVSQNCAGNEFAEMYDLNKAGVVGFTDGTNPIQSAIFLSKSLQYLKPLNKVLIQTPFDQDLTKTGLMNEGVQSTSLGLLGIPAIAEEMMIARDLEILKYTNGKIHFNCVSTIKGIELIDQAKKDGFQVTCSVSPFHLLFDENDIQNYETNLKVLQPLRTQEDKLALRKALKNNRIDCIASNHFPIHEDEKKCDFSSALYGMNTLEYCFAAIIDSVPKIKLEQLINLFSLQPRKIMNLPIVTIQENETASFTIFNLEKQTKINANNIISKSKNIGKENLTLNGRIFGVIHKNYLTLNKI